MEGSDWLQIHLLVYIVVTEVGSLIFQLLNHR
jgi:hypothetical protein